MIHSGSRGALAPRTRRVRGLPLALALHGAALHGTALHQSSGSRRVAWRAACDHRASLARGWPSFATRGTSFGIAWCTSFGTRLASLPLRRARSRTLGAAARRAACYAARWRAVLAFALRPRATFAGGPALAF